MGSKAGTVGAGFEGAGCRVRGCRVRGCGVRGCRVQYASARAHHAHGKGTCGHKRRQGTLGCTQMHRHTQARHTQARHCTQRHTQAEGPHPHAPVTTRLVCCRLCVKDVHLSHLSPQNLEPANPYTLAKACSLRWQAAGAGAGSRRRRRQQAQAQPRPPPSLSAPPRLSLCAARGSRDLVSSRLCVEDG